MPSDPSGPGRNPRNVTPSNDALPYVATRIYVGGTGDVVVEDGAEESATFTAVPAGTTLHVEAHKILPATTATDITISR